MRRDRFAVTIVAVVAGIGLLGLAGYSSAGTPARSPSAAAAAETTTDASADQPLLAVATSAPAAPKALATSAGSPQTLTTSPPRPKPTRKPVSDRLPPPAPSPRYMPGICPFHEGVDAPKTEVKTALEAAAAQKFWTVSQVTLPAKLIKAVAWQESGWQSTIIACDGGIGTMQVMPNTAEWMNTRFETNYDVHTLTGNTMIGSAYLQWLIKWFGDSYFNGDYTVDAADCASGDPNVPDYTTPCLLNAVIASYNYGYAAVGTANGIVIPNPQYVMNVRALMTMCPCFAY